MDRTTHTSRKGFLKRAAMAVASTLALSKTMQASTSAGIPSAAADKEAEGTHVRVQPAKGAVARTPLG